MKIFLYSSPYRYYKNNLLPLAKRFSNLGHDVYMSHSYKKTNSLKRINEEVDFIGREPYKEIVRSFLTGDFVPDVVILTQAWWFLEKEIVKKCKQARIPYYILDHAAPVIKYSEKSGKKSHAYRNNIMGARTHIVWGQESKSIMQERGCKDSMHVLGSPRVEDFMAKKNSKKVSSLLKKYGDKIAVFYDTNDKMFDKKVNKKLENIAFFLKKSGFNVFLKPHVRSRLHKNSLKNITIFNDKRMEDELIFASRVLLFTFPSSVMIFGAVAKKPMVSLYSDHWSKDARKFSKKYSKMFLNPSSINQIIPYINQKVNYDEFVNRNLFFKKNEPSVDRIIKFIIEDMKRDNFND